MGDNNGPRVVFWVMLLLAWPFTLWQVFCIMVKRPVPFGQYKAGHFYVELMRDGVVDQAAVSHAWTMVAMGAALFLVITIIAYMNSYYQGSR